MGLTIHYKGKLSAPQSVQALTEEVRDIAETLGWMYNIISDEQVAGIVTAPENCEPIWLTFLKDGTLVSLSYLEFNIDGKGWVSTKTQFAGMDAHMAVVRLIRHLSKKYFQDFTMEDEGHYWETDDVNLLRKQFATYEALIDAVTTALEDFPALPGETPAGLAERLERLLKDSMGGPDNSPAGGGAA